MISAVTGLLLFIAGVIVGALLMLIFAPRTPLAIVGFCDEPGL